jgi:exopolysaccharide production protein ExoZ
MEPGAERRDVLPGIQVLRAVAALMVVIHHAELGTVIGFGLDLPYLFLVGSAGVDVFFVISGFIMLVSSRRLFGRPDAPATFLMRRVIRIAPLYWAVTTVYVAGFLLVPGWLGRSVSGGTMAASYLFWPHLGLDGTFHPVLVVGWTLNYEMFFYALFALAVLFPRERAVLVVSLALAAFVLLRSIVVMPTWPLAFWGEPIVLEFAAGLLVGLAYERRLLLPPWLATVAFGAGAAAFLAQLGDPIPGGWPRLLLYGLPSLLLVAGAALARTTGRRSGPPRVLTFLGDASYSIYLTHLLTLTAMRFLAKATGVVPKTASSAYAFAGGSMLLALIVGAITFVMFERRVTDRLRDAFHVRRAAA